MNTHHIITIEDFESYIAGSLNDTCGGEFNTVVPTVEVEWVKYRTDSLDLSLLIDTRYHTLPLFNMNLNLQNAPSGMVRMYDENSIRYRFLCNLNKMYWSGLHHTIEGDFIVARLAGGLNRNGPDNKVFKFRSRSRA